MNEQEPNRNAPELTETEITGLELTEKTQIMQLVDALLKSPRSVYEQVERNAFATHVSKLALIFSLCVLAYGLIVGSFSGDIQWLAAPLKIFLGTCLAVLLCFPSLYIFSALSGADLRPGQLAGLLLSALALVGILLLGFAPVAFIFTFSIQALPFMGAIHLLIWSVSLYFGLRYLAHGLGALGGSNQLMIKTWAMIFVLTLLQMSTTLRPILGQADTILTTEKAFFLAHWLASLR
jgi:hypothetical protein